MWRRKLDDLKSKTAKKEEVKAGVQNKLNELE